MGILHTFKNVGIFPEVEGSPECSPDAINCNMATFRNYPGVEDQAITGEEMDKHIEKGHLVAFDKREQLTGYVEGTPPLTPILNKIGLIVKNAQRYYQGPHNPGHKAKRHKENDGEDRADHITSALRRDSKAAMSHGSGGDSRCRGQRICIRLFGRILGVAFARR